jgi:hypothetical protein
MAGSALLLAAFWAFVKYRFKKTQVLLRMARPFMQYRFLTQITLLSAGRYLIFCVQFATIYHLLGGSLPWWQAMGGIMLIFLIKSLLPLIAFGELGIREGIAFGVFALLGKDAHIAVSASLMLWTFNLLIPSVIGAFMLPMKIKTKRPWNLFSLY